MFALLVIANYESGRIRLTEAREVDKVRFERYRKRFSPYGSVAALYLLSISGGAIPELTDPLAEKDR